MNTYSRPTLREALLSGNRRLEVFFYTSNLPKYLHASTVFDRSGLWLKHFKSKTDPYAEEYEAGKERLLTRAIAQVLDVLGKQSVLFVEDTSLRINALSRPDVDFPGLAVKEWFSSTSFEELDHSLRSAGKDRSATIKSDIALHVPGLSRPVFFHGEVSGCVADTSPSFAENGQYPWLTPHTFNGWFIPDGASKCLGEMSLEESWAYDFRTQALEHLLARLEEYATILNLPPHSYSRLRTIAPTNQLLLFPITRPVLIVVGKTCAGKSTFGERAAKQHAFCWVEASNVLRTFRSEYSNLPPDDFEFAKSVLEQGGWDVVARKVLHLYAGDLERGLVITGFRTIEELETIKSRISYAQVVVVEGSERARFQRHLARGRSGKSCTLSEFRAQDTKQWSFGLLRVAEDFADIKITNERTLQDYWPQIDAVVMPDAARKVPGVVQQVHPRHGVHDNQMYRCLLALSEAGRSLSCDELEKDTGKSGQSIRHNNTNKVLKRVPELARRIEPRNDRVRYEITNAGRAYTRYMKATYDGDDGG